MRKFTNILLFTLISFSFVHAQSSAANPLSEAIQEFANIDTGFNNIIADSTKLDFSNIKPDSNIHIYNTHKNIFITTLTTNKEKINENYKSILKNQDNEYKKNKRDKDLQELINKYKNLSQSSSKHLMRLQRAKASGYPSDNLTKFLEANNAASPHGLTVFSKGQSTGSLAFVNAEGKYIPPTEASNLDELIAASSGTAVDAVVAPLENTASTLESKAEVNSENADNIVDHYGRKVNVGRAMGANACTTNSLGEEICPDPSVISTPSLSNNSSSANKIVDGADAKKKTGLLSTIGNCLNPMKAGCSTNENKSMLGKLAKSALVGGALLWGLEESGTTDIIDGLGKDKKSKKKKDRGPSSLNDGSYADDLTDEDKERIQNAEKAAFESNINQPPNKYFRWKPVSEKGQLVILTPADEKVTKVVIKGAFGEERGSDYGYSNGMRKTFRFSKPGGEYGNNITVMVEGGDDRCISNGSSEYDSEKVKGDAPIMGQCSEASSLAESSSEVNSEVASRATASDEHGGSTDEHGSASDEHGGGDKVSSETQEVAHSSGAGCASTFGNGFVYKPLSEGDGNLVVLIPASYSGGSLTVAGESGRNVGRTNGNRLTFRFSKTGCAYGNNVSLSSNGKTCTIPSGCNRVD